MASESAPGPGAAAVERLGDRRARPRVAWVARLTGATPAKVETALRGIDRHLSEVEAIRSSHKQGGRSFYAQIRSPFDLYALTRLLRPSSIVETGVSSGVSSAHFLVGSPGTELEFAL